MRALMACRRGILIKARSVALIRSILRTALIALFSTSSDEQPLRHGNIRGQGYFHSTMKPSTRHPHP